MVLVSLKTSFKRKLAATLRENIKFNIEMIFFLLRVECHGTLQQRDFFLRTLEHWPTPTLATLVGLNIIAIILITDTISIIVNAIIVITQPTQATHLLEPTPPLLPIPRLIFCHR